MALHKLCSLWKNKSGKGMSGRIEYDQYSEAAMEILEQSITNKQEVRLMVFRKDKKHERSPDAAIFVADD